MDKKKIGFFAILAAMILIIIGIVISTIQSNKKDNETGTKEKTELTEFEKEVDKHAEYIQDYEKDPFNEQEDTSGEIKIDNLNFNFEYINGSTYENTAATLIDSSKNFLLFHNYNNVLSFYDKKLDKKYVADEHFNLATLTVDENYIVYSKNVFDSEAFYYLDLETLQKKEFYIYHHSSRMKAIDMKVKDGLVYFIVQDESGKTSIHFTALPAYIDSHTAKERNSVVNINADKLYFLNNKVLAFNKTTNSVDEILPANQPMPMIRITSEKVKQLRSVDYYDEKKWAIAITNDKNEHLIITPDKKVKDFDGLMSAFWFDKNHLVVIDNLSLYLYNLESGKTDVMKAGISYVFPTLETLTIQTSNGEILTLKKEKR